MMVMGDESDDWFAEHLQPREGEALRPSVVQICAASLLKPSRHCGTAEHSARRCP